MPQYVILAEHQADRCPSGNARLRSYVEKAMTETLPQKSQELGVTFTVGPLHLDPGHRTVSVVEAPSVEAVTKPVFEAGLSQWNTVEVAPATPVPQLMAETAHIPPISD